MSVKLIYEKGRPGRKGVMLPKSDVPAQMPIPAAMLRDTLADLPEVSELDVVRHFNELSRRNHGVDTNFYPLGSCTMKYNPKLGEEACRYDGFAALHPLLPQLRLGGMLTQGALQVIYDTERMLSEITGMAEFTMQPLAGAHGELTGVMLIAAYHRDRGNHKTKILTPDTAHGTNPASAAIAGYSVVTVPSDSRGRMDMAAFRNLLDDDVAAVMMTNPSTVGLFEYDALEIARLAHERDALMYYDGANLNAILGRCRPGDIGFDVMHVNLHKTFATPHGGGGPGAGPVGVCDKLREYLPISLVVKRFDGTFALEYDRPKSIGYIAPFYGNFAIVLRAYSYMLTLGREGLLRVSENAVLNANYIFHRLKDLYAPAYDEMCKHECVLSAQTQSQKGVRALDIAKMLIDRGFHPPTIYFPITVKECIMVEPTETESLETMDSFIEAMRAIATIADETPDDCHAAPVTTPIGRLDEVAAVKMMDFCFRG